MVYLAIREKKGEERKNWMGVYSFQKANEAWVLLSTLRHSDPSRPDYEEPCSYRVFQEDQENEAMTWAGVTEITGKSWTTKVDIPGIISARNPRSGRNLGFNAMKEAQAMRRKSNRNVERVTGHPNWNRHREGSSEKIVTTGERLNEILNYYLRRDIRIVTMTFQDGSASNIVVDNVWYINDTAIEYQGKTFTGKTFQQLYEDAKEVIPLPELNDIIIRMAVKIPKSKLDVINDMIFFPEFGQLVMEKDPICYKFSGKTDQPLQYSILKSAAALTTIAPNQLSLEITDKVILKELIDKEKFGV